MYVRWSGKSKLSVGGYVRVNACFSVVAMWWTCPGWQPYDLPSAIRQLEETRADPSDPNSGYWKWALKMDGWMFYYPFIIFSVSLKRRSPNCTAMDLQHSTAQLLTTEFLKHFHLNQGQNITNNWLNICNVSPWDDAKIKFNTKVSMQRFTLQHSASELSNVSIECDNALTMYELFNAYNRTWQSMRHVVRCIVSQGAGLAPSSNGECRHRTCKDNNSKVTMYHWADGGAD